MKLKKTKQKRPIRDLKRPEFESPPLLPFQKVGVWYGTRVFKGRFFLGDDIGLGKTPQSLHIARWLIQENNLTGPIVVTCPASVKLQWEVEVHKHVGWRSWVLNGLTPPAKMPLHIPPVIILNWDILRQKWTDQLIQLRPSVIIADEVHAIKNRSTVRAKEFRRLVQGVQNLIFLTGTAIENNPIEFFNALNILRRDVFPAFKTFAFRYSIPQITPWGIKYSGSANEKELHDLIRKTCFLRRTKKKVLKQLPPIRRVMVPIYIKRKEYEEAETNFLSWLRKNNPKKVVKVKNAIHLAKIQYLLGLIAKLKLPGIIEWIKEFHESTGKKYVLFGHHRAFLEELEQAFPRTSTLVYGGMNVKKRQAAIDRFVEDRNCNLFLGSITATGTGINKLQTVCSDAGIGEFIYNGQKILQSEGRLHRIGQMNSVTVNYFAAKRTVETKLCKAIFEKQEMIDSILDGKEEGKHDFDLLKYMFPSKRKRKYT